MADKRFQLMAVNVSSTATAIGVSVSVQAAGDRMIVGAAAGVGANLATTAVRATLRAVVPAVPYDVQVDQTATAEIAGSEVAVVSIVVGPNTVSGSAAVGIRTVPEAFARATLDALNRIIAGAENEVRIARHKLVYEVDPV